MNVEKIIYFGKSPVLSALEHFRVYAPLKQAGITLIPGWDADALNLNGIKEAQLVLLQRDFARDFRAYQHVLDTAEESGVPVVLDLDDDLLALPPEHPDRISNYYTDSLSPLLHAIVRADALTVTTAFLREMLLPYNANIYVLPNYLDANLWQLRAPQPSGREEPVCILFVGTPTHKPDLALVAEPLERIAARYGDRVQLQFYGCEPPQRLLELPQTSYQPLRTYEYTQFVREMAALKADIAIAPLVDNRFNRSKSSVKFLEYSAMGLPGVYARLEPYTQIAQHGEDAFLASSPQEWEEYLRCLIEDSALREQMARRAQEKLCQDWLLQDHANLWPQTYQKVLDQKKQPKQASAAMIAALASIGQQVQEQSEQDALVQRQLQTEHQAQVDQLQIEHQAQVDQLQAQIDCVEQQKAGLARLKAVQEQQIESLQAQIAEAQEEISRQAGALQTAQSLLVEQEQTLQGISHALEETHQALEAARQETVAYANSLSWKLTRPLRRLARFIRRK